MEGASPIVTIIWEDRGCCRRRLGVSLCILGRMDELEPRQAGKQRPRAAAMRNHTNKTAPASGPERSETTLAGFGLLGWLKACACPRWFGVCRQLHTGRSLLRWWRSWSGWSRTATRGVAQSLGHNSKVMQPHFRKETTLKHSKTFVQRDFIHSKMAASDSRAAA